MADDFAKEQEDKEEELQRKLAELLRQGHTAKQAAAQLRKQRDAWIAKGAKYQNQARVRERESWDLFEQVQRGRSMGSAWWALIVTLVIFIWTAWSAQRHFMGAALLLVFLNQWRELDNCHVKRARWWSLGSVAVCFALLWNA